ncbi:hypothetical protein L873DRAFT_1634490, partial [Choiromyces venosus 120613-1]
ILAWISPLESWKRHHDVSSARFEGLGDWVLGTSKFRTWQDEGNSASVEKTLFCSGIPGAGKTFICSLVIDVLCDRTVGSNVGIACLYCDYRGQKEQALVNMIGSLLRQFVTGLPEIPDNPAKVFRAAKGQLGGRALKLEKMIEIFPQVLASFDKTIICIDALDEFGVDNRARFFQLLRYIVEKSPNTRLFLTGRPHIQLELDKHFAMPIAVINIQPSPNDIRLYLTTKLDNDSEHDAMDDELRAEIMTKVAKKDSEMSV